jgi:hypothetical protein
MLGTRLASNGFEVQRAKKFGNVELALLAGKTHFELSKFGDMTYRIFGLEFKNPDAGIASDFSRSMTNFYLDNFARDRSKSILRLKSHGYLSMPLMVSTDIGQSLRSWVTGFIPEKRWAAFEFPVLVSLSERKIYHSMNTSLWGAAYYSGFRDFVERNLGF